MTDKKTAIDLLDGAYAVRTPEDSVDYYADFAAIYDDAFAGDLGYVYPRAVAETYRDAAGPDDRPVADIGCGTGLVAASLGLPADQVDGFDISPEMLDQARAKGLYRDLLQLDLTRPITHPRRYGALVSAGTFTYGHLGPDTLENVLTLGAPGALCVIGINATHFERERFADTLDRLQDSGRITAPARKTIDVYDTPDIPNGADKAQVLVFRLT